MVSVTEEQSHDLVGFIDWYMNNLVYAQIMPFTGTMRELNACIWNHASYQVDWPVWNVKNFFVLLDFARYECSLSLIMKPFMFWPIYLFIFEQ